MHSIIIICLTVFNFFILLYNLALFKLINKSNNELISVLKQENEKIFNLYNQIKEEDDKADWWKNNK